MIDAIKQKVDIVDLIGKDETHLRQIGEDFRSGHYSKHSSNDGRFLGTSLSVSTSQQTWYCFECEKGGSVLEWVMDRDNCDLRGAIQSLASEYGIADDGTFDAKAYELRKSIRAIIKEAFQFYRSQLSDDHRFYLKDRGLTDETIDNLLIGYAPAGGSVLRDHFKGAGYSNADLLATGLFFQASNRAYDHYQDRLVFPYWLRDETVYSIGRLPSDEPDAIEKRHESDRHKYKKHMVQRPDRQYVSASAVENCIYGQNSLRGKSEILLTEGIIDAILAHQEGYACLSPVTIRFQKRDIDEIVRLCERADTVYIVNDNEVNEQGRQGALDTGAVLFVKGIDARLVTIPRDEGVDKIDLADFLKAGGDLRTVLDDAQAYLNVIIADIAKLNGKRRTQEIMSLLKVIKALEPVERDNALDEMAKAKLGRITTLREQMKGAKRVETVMPEGAIDLRSHRKVTEQSDHYTAWDSETETLLEISNFIIVPKLRVTIDEKETVIADFACANQTFADVHIDRNAWNDKRAFMNCIPSVDCWFDGTLSHIQSILAIVAGYDVSTKRGSRKIGRENDLWLLPDGAITVDGYIENADVAYVPQGGASEWSKIISVREQGYDTVFPAVAEYLPQLNAAHIALGAIGWFFATPFKDAITKKHGGFPFLHVTGTRGTGKSTFIRVLARLFEYNDNAVLFSCDQTPFVLLRLLSSTSTIPVILDEYKYDMDPKKRASLVRYVRRTYNGETEMRGNVDQTLSQYTLTAPVVLAGEVDITESAILERMIHLPFSPSGLDDKAKDAYEKLRNLPLNAFFDKYVTHTLQVDFGRDYGTLASLFEDAIPSCADRVRDNLKTMLFGIYQFHQFMGIKGDFYEIAKAACIDIVAAGAEDNDTSRVGLDTFIEHIAVLAAMGRAKRGTHFDVRDEILAVRLMPCFAEFRRYAREINIDDEVLSANAYRRQARENENGYIIDPSRAFRFANGNVFKCMLIHIDLAEAAGLQEMDSFVYADDDEERNFV